VRRGSIIRIIAITVRAIHPMLTQLSLGIVGALLVNQVFARFINRSCGVVWPHLAIRLVFPTQQANAERFPPGGRRSTDLQLFVSDETVETQSTSQVGFNPATYIAAAAAPSVIRQNITLPGRLVGPTWKGWRKVRVDACRNESPDCRSFRLVPIDGEAFPNFRAGQSLLVGFPDPVTGKRITRCYSLSGGPGESYYRITVKRVPGGILSNLLHDLVDVNDVIEIQPPRGTFHPSPDLQHQPLVLIAAGIGITPMLSMFLENLERSPARPIDIFYQLRTPGNAPFLNLLRQSVHKLPPDLPTRLHVHFSQPDGYRLRPGDSLGRLSAQRIIACCGEQAGEYMICGPEDFMTSIAQGLVAGGVSAERVHYESFGGKPKGVGAIHVGDRPAIDSDEPRSMRSPDVTRTHQVVFETSGREAVWTGAEESLLELAESIDLEVNSACRAGDCGACLVRLVHGSVTYPVAPTCDVQPGEVVACIARPQSDLRIEE